MWQAEREAVKLHQNTEMVCIHLCLLSFCLFVLHLVYMSRYNLISKCVRETGRVVRATLDYSLQQQVKGLTCVRGTLLQGVGGLRREVVKELPEGVQGA